MTNKKIKRATGSYTQELVNNQPVVPTVPVENPTVAAGVNSYQAYVNEGAPKTPVQTSSVVTPVQNPTVPMEGQYTRNLVKPKQMKNEVGGVETGGEKKLEVEDPNSYIAALREREESIVDQYNEDINYAEQLKDDAYKKAKDQYDIAMREAQGNFRANQPTYGAKAEQLLASGLTGGGYSDYLGGKAYEARTDEINAARSQQSYAQYLADQDYRDMMHQAEQDKFDRQYANDQWKLEYGVQLDAEYKAKVEEILAGIAAGSYTAEIAKKELENYAPNGVISENIIGAIDAAEYEYWKKNDAALLAEYMTYVEAEIANGGLGSRELMRDYLKNSSKLTDTQIEVYLDAYYNADGSLKDAKDRPSAGNTGNTGNAGNTGNSGSTGNAGNTGNTGDSGSGGNNEKKEGLEGYLSDLEASGTVSAEGIKDIRDKLAGTVISSGVLKKNGGFRQDFSSGDDFRVVIGDKTYRIESGGKVTAADVINVAKSVGDGTIFGYGGELYIKSGSDTYKIQARPGLFSGQYGKLWDAVYVEAANKLVDGKDIAESNADKIQRGNARFKNDAWGNDTSLAAGDNFNIYAGGKTYRVKSGGEANDPDINALITSSGIEDGEVFAYRNQAYLYKDGKIYSVDTRALGLNQEKKLISMITGNAYSAADSVGNYSETWLDLGSNERDTLNAGDSIGLLPWAGSKEYKVVVGAVLGKETAAYKYGEGFADGQAYYYGDDIYVKKGDNAYLIAKNKRQYDKLAEYLNRNETKMDIVASGNVAEPDNYDGIEAGQTRYKINGQNFDFELVRVHKSINDPIYREAQANGITAGQMFIFNGQPFIMGNNQFSQLRYDGDIGDIQAALNAETGEGGSVGNNGGDIQPEENGGETQENNKVTSDAPFVAQGGNTIGEGIVLADDGNNHKTLNINDTTYGVSKMLSRNSDRWEKSAIDYATNEGIASGTVFTFKDQSGEHYCYATSDKNGNQVFYELTSSPDGWNTFGEKAEAPTINNDASIDDNKNKVSFSDWVKNTGEGISGAFKTAGEKIKGFFGRKEAEEKANANNAENKVDRAYNAGVSGEGLSDKGLAKGDWFTIDVVDIKGSNTKYRVKSGGAVEDSAAIYAEAKDAGIYDGEVFGYGDEAYVMKGGKIYSIDTRLLSPKQEDKLLDALSEDIYAPEKDENVNGISKFKGDVQTNTTTVNEMETYKSNDTIKVSTGDGKTYNVKVGTVLSGLSEAYKAANANQIKKGQAFIYRGSVYVMGDTALGKETVYKLTNNASADKLADFLNSNFNEKAAAQRTASNIKVLDSVKMSTTGGTTTSYNSRWALDNYPSSANAKYIVIQIPDNNGKVEEVTHIDIIGKYNSESNAYIAAEGAGFSQEDKYELFLWNNHAYVWLGDSVVELKNDDKLLNYLNNNQQK